MKVWFSRMWKENKTFFLFIVLMFVFRSTLADWNPVPTGSMKPTILEGDRILVNKMAYDIRIPFTHISLYEITDPARGDIIIFDSAVSEKKLVKRVVGIPGDIISLEDNILYVNGEQLPYQDVSSTSFTTDRMENLSGTTHLIRINKTGSILSNFQAIEVPAGYYLALGDNRDNSADSRVIGLVPRKEIVGKTRRVILSLNYDNYYIPRSDRFFKTL